jgi:hypothetical protein
MVAWNMVVCQEAIVVLKRHIVYMYVSSVITTLLTTIP